MKLLNVTTLPDTLYVQLWLVYSTVKLDSGKLPLYTDTTVCYSNSVSGTPAQL